MEKIVIHQRYTEKNVDPKSPLENFFNNSQQNTRLKLVHFSTDSIIFSVLVLFGSVASNIEIVIMTVNFETPAPKSYMIHISKETLQAGLQLNYLLQTQYANGICSKRGIGLAFWDGGTQSSQSESK